jgi:hypothetical protein
MTRDWIKLSLVLFLFDLAGFGPALSAARAADGDELSPEQRESLAALGKEAQGAVLYARKGRIKKVVLGELRAHDLGEGECARFSPDGKRVAVFHDKRVHVMDADGRNRRQILEGADWPEDGCAIEVHANGKEIIYVKKKDGLWSVRIADGKTARLDLPGQYNGEISMSADGKRMTARRGQDLYAVDLVARTHRKFARGCSPGVSPDGKLVMNNTGGHHEMVIRGWSEEQGYRVSGRDAQPDGSWDDFHWSNHADFIAAAGDRKKEESYVLRLSDKRVFRVTWEGKTRFPDVFIARAGKTAARGRNEPGRKDATTARPETAPAASPAATTASAPPARPPARPEAAPVETPAEPAGPPPPPPARPWPVSEEGLVFAWENAQKPNEFRGRGGRAFTCQVEARDAATFSRHFGMDLSGGAFLPEDADSRLLEALRGRGELSIEAVITPRPAEAGRPRGKIVSFGRNFTLRQHRQDLRLAIGGAPPGALDDRAAARRPAADGEIVLASISDDRPTHVLAAYRAGLLAFYVNGSEVFRTDAIRADLRRAEPARLVFGAVEADRHAWQGALEAVALYGRFVDAPEAAEKARALEARLAGRTAPARSHVRARLVRASEIPDPKAIEPYRRALVVGKYEIVGPAAGLARHVQIARWAILDGRLVGGALRAKPGEERDLALEPFEGHPQLDSERLIGDGDADSPLFVDVSPIDRSDLRPAARPSRLAEAGPAAGRR